MMMNSATVAIPINPAITLPITTAPSQTIVCVLQARIGGLDRVLGAITHRGWIPTHFESVLCSKTDTLQVTISFCCEDFLSVQKLVKFLEKQVYVLSATLVPTANVAETSNLLTPVKERSA